MAMPFNHMNQFLFVYSFSHERKVKDALINEAHEIGLLPMGQYFHFGVVEMDTWSREMTVTIFRRDKDKLIAHIKGSKASSMILFRYNPYESKDMGGIDLDKEPLPVLNEAEVIDDQYFIMGDIMIPRGNEFTKFFKSLGLSLKRDKTPDSDKELFLSQFALIKQGTMKTQLFKEISSSFIIIQYDWQKPFLTEDSMSAKIEKLWFGCNNDKMRTWKNSKFLFVSSRYSGEKGRSERKGALMGGNTILLDLMSGNSGTIKPFDYFVKPYSMDMVKGRTIIKPWDVGIPNGMPLTGFYKFDDINQTFKSYNSPIITNEEVNDMLSTYGGSTKSSSAKTYPVSANRKAWREYDSSSRILVKAEDAETARVVIFR